MIPVLVHVGFTDETVDLSAPLSPHIQVPIPGLGHALELEGRGKFRAAGINWEIDKYGVVRGIHVYTEKQR